VAIKKSRVIYNRGQEYDEGFEMSERPAPAGQLPRGCPAATAGRRGAPRARGRKASSARQRSRGGRAPAPFPPLPLPSNAFQT
jgi:hypothetical protein